MNSSTKFDGTNCIDTHCFGVDCIDTHCFGVDCSDTHCFGVLCIGSNHQREQSFELAHQLLQVLLPGIRFATCRETEPLGLTNKARFWNQVGVFESNRSVNELRALFKEIERKAGRLPEDKKQEKICLDIDLLCYNRNVLKPEELKRDYIVESFKELQAALTAPQEEPSTEPQKQKQDMKFLGIIPARYASTRFPAKPLAMLGGKTVIQRVYEQVASVLNDVYVATDDERIETAVKAFGGKVVMTSVAHQSGTDRCYEACCKIGGDFDVVVNIQGDEPFVASSQLLSLKACFDDPCTQIATLAKPFAANDAFATLENVNSPKVVMNQKGNALYFSRSIIPYQRNADKQEWLQHHTYYKHIGLYAYRTEVLRELTSLPQSPLELAESLEQLRWLENGYTIKVGLSTIETIGIDTPEDLALAERFLNTR